MGSTPDEEPSSIWPGMGGWSGTSGELIQDGTEQDAYNGAASQYYFWIELYPYEAEQQITNLVPAVGDAVYVETDYVTPNANFHVCDLTQNACVYGLQSSIPPGNSVEWIVERTSLGNSLYPLPNFGSVLLYDTYWYNSANTASGTPADAGAFPVQMCNSACDTQLDSVGSLGSDGQAFPVTWLNAGP